MTCTCGEEDHDDDVLHRYDGQPCFHMTCPECGGEVQRMYTCHSWGWKDDGTGKMVGGMSCIGCNSAMHYYCAADFLSSAPRCRWSYTDGMNPRNPKSEANNARKPAWLEGLKGDGIW